MYVNIIKHPEFVVMAAVERINNPSLANVLKQSSVWRGRTWSPTQSTLVCNPIDTGYTQLNQQLVQGGWPRGGITECLLDQAGFGEMQLLLPALAHCSQQHGAIFMVAPPYLPLPERLQAAGINLSALHLLTPGKQADSVWAVDQICRGNAGCATLLWLPDNIDHAHLRKLQLAAREGNHWLVLLRPGKARHQASPAQLRLYLQPDNTSHQNHLELMLCKQRGTWAGQTLSLPVQDYLADIDSQQLPLPEANLDMTRSRMISSQAGQPTTARIKTDQSSALYPSALRSSVMDLPADLSTSAPENPTPDHNQHTPDSPAVVTLQ